MDMSGKSRGWRGSSTMINHVSLFSKVFRDKELKESNGKNTKHRRRRTDEIESSGPSRSLLQATIPINRR